MNKQQEPRLRFQGFAGAWEEKVLGELGYCFSGIGFPENEQGRENGIPFFKVSDMNLSGNEIYLRKANNYVTQEQIDKQRWQVIQQLPCIFFAKIGAALLLNRKRLVCNPFLLDNNTMAFILSLNLDDYFIKTLFDTIDLPALAQIGALPSISAKDIEKNIVFIPTAREQTHLGLFFRRLDSQIAESRSVLEKSRQLKKAMLAKMFPANGEKIPRIRFKGFAGEWESRKLGIEVEIIGGGTPDTTNSAYWNGDIDWYSPTEIGEAAYANGSVKKITLLGLQKSSAQILPANRTVLFTSRASIGDMAILTRDGATNQGFQSFVVGERLDVYFLYTMGFKIKDYALKNASGSTFLEISKNTLSQMEFFAPSLKEQTAIGNFFRQLDETIALQSAEVEKLNQLKKGLLAAMLV